jgi:ABC-type Fe3+/spermidine/putrescine transport system ATPase subunit
MSDLIVVMSEGRVEQVGAPEEVYNAPATEFVARFLGAANIIEADQPWARRATRSACETPIFGSLAVPRDQGARS